MLAVVFPGQGSQKGGMGADLVERSDAARELFARADAVLGFSLSQLCFEGSDADLRPTEIAQPALLTCGYAYWLAASDALGEPAVFAGHSLGEYTALVAAGALEFEPALRLVRRRGELMAAAGAEQPGAMAAVLNLDDEVVARLCDGIAGIVVPANYNSPGQVVVSGEGEAVDALAAAAKGAGGRVMKLPVSGAFHSPLMQPAADRLAEELRATSFADARVPVVQNVTAEPTVDSDVLRANLAAQMTGSVRWTESVRAMAALGATRMVEVGPGTVLTKLAGRIDGELDTYSVNSAEAVDGLPGWVG